MAPESERACMKCGHPRNAHDLEQPYQCFHLPEGAFEYSCDCDGFSYAPPTLTCSEVVERLAECADIEYTKDKLGGIYTATFNRAKAEAILHSWRERRVQELEEHLRELRPHLTGWMRESAERVLESEEWREQIRKGAKHE